MREPKATWHRKDAWPSYYLCRCTDGKHEDRVDFHTREIADSITALQAENIALREALEEARRLLTWRTGGSVSIKPTETTTLREEGATAEGQAWVTTEPRIAELRGLIADLYASTIEYFSETGHIEGVEHPDDIDDRIDGVLQAVEAALHAAQERAEGFKAQRDTLIDQYNAATTTRDAAVGLLERAKVYAFPGSPLRADLDAFLAAHDSGPASTDSRKET